MVWQRIQGMERGASFDFKGWKRVLARLVACVAYSLARSLVWSTGLPLFVGLKEENLKMARPGD